MLPLSAIVPVGLSSGYFVVPDHRRKTVAFCDRGNMLSGLSHIASISKVDIALNGSACLTYKSQIPTISGGGLCTLSQVQITPGILANSSVSPEQHSPS